MIALGFERLGFRENPFKRGPLENPEEYRNLFIKKEDKYIDFLLQLGKTNSVFCLEGKFGIGKTTSYNGFSYFAPNERNSLVLDRPIEVKDFMNSADVLSQIVERVVNVIKILTETKKLNKKVEGKINEIYYSVTSISNETQTTGSITLPIAGVERTKTKGITQAISKSHLFDRLKYDLETLGEIAVEELGYRNICLALDELEFHKINPSKSADIIGGLRNAFFTKNYCFCLIGDSGLESRLSTEPRFRRALSLGVELTPLTSEEFNEVLEKRFDFYKSRKDYISPFKEGVFNDVYALADGDVRWAIEILEKMFDLVVRKDLPQKIGIDDITKIIFGERPNKYSSLTEEKWNILDAIAKFGEMSPSDKDVQEFLKKERTTISGHLHELENKYVDLVRKRIEGRKHLYYLGPDGVILKEEGYIGVHT